MNNSWGCFAVLKDDHVRSLLYSSRHTETIQQMLIRVINAKRKGFRVRR